MTRRSAFNRREFIHTTAVATGGWLAGDLMPPATAAGVASPPLTAASLPKGSAPKPVAFPHFPGPLHAFIWRNWQLVPTERMAAVVGCRRTDILQLGQTMGLGTPPRITREQQRRSPLSVIKRNWHLLPYEQLLALLGWTPEQLAFTLREDDFLYLKLGSLKPQCDPIRWVAPDETTQRRAARFARVVREEFARPIDEPKEPLFRFVQDLATPPPSGAPRRPQPAGLRFCYSYFALYGDPLLEPDLDPYPNGYLERLATVGVNGVWLQAVLYKLARFPWKPELSARFEERLQSLRALVARAKRRGVRVFLYLNEPRAMPLDFYADHAALKGVVAGDHAALCTSDPGVQDYLRDAVESVSRAVPDLGGFFTISASENLTNCWSHGAGANCPRCRQRSPAEVIAEVNRLFQAGIQRAGGRQRLLAWDWGWNDAWAGDVIQRLPDGVSVMSVSEWSLPIERGGVKTLVGEYSISAVGPGPRATRHWELARSRGLRTVAKIQAGNTWELSATPWIPALENVAQHAANLRHAGVQDIMLGWTLGGYPSPNLEVVDEILRMDRRPLDAKDIAGALLAVATRRVGERDAPALVDCWRQCSAAFREFPYEINVVYKAPLQNGPSNLLWATPTGYHATMVGFPYDDLDQWRGPYPAETFITQLEQVANGVDAAIARLQAHRVRTAPSQSGKALTTHGRALDGEIRIAMAASIHWRSVANQARFVKARRNLTGATNSGATAPWLEELERTLRSELDLARRLHALQSQDSRIGFEASNQYYYVPLDLVEKVVNCRCLLDEWLPALRAGLKP